MPTLASINVMFILAAIVSALASIISVVKTIRTRRFYEIKKATRGIEELLGFVSDPNPDRRSLAAFNLSIPEILETLSKDPNPEVRRMVLLNHAAPPKALAKLAQDPDLGGRPTGEPISDADVAKVVIVIGAPDGPQLRNVPSRSTPKI